ncbi:MAG: tRNA pseudouridine(38-40) synthase TruA [Lachnospiraceae bacterium]|nr:tRNA pseudouridine(38-40) synthase TruA [Lachnospiraceae bacterium]
MRRILIRIAYDGTAYHGFAAQALEPETIEGHLAAAVKEITGEDTEIIGTSRTDAGVHARDNAAVFDTESRIPAERFALALNTKLPPDIVVTSSGEVHLDFHPRHNVSEKTYEYKIYNARIPDPLMIRYSHFCSRPLDVGKMRAAAECLVGEHDFTSFASVHMQAKSPVRTINSIEVIHGDGVCGSFSPGLITIRVKGTGFLYNMVRIIAGTLMEAGFGSITPEKMQEILDAKDRTRAGTTAPACGLTLMQIDFKLNET